jgi:hypothetical protein
MRQSNNPIETALNAFSTVRGFGRERDPYEDLKMESMQLNNSLAQLQLDQLRNPNAGFDPLTEYGKALKEAEQLDALGRSDEAEQARQFAAAVLQRRQSLESPTMAFDAQGNPLFATGGQYLPGQSNPLSSVLGTSGIGGAFEDRRRQGGGEIDHETGVRVIRPTRVEVWEWRESLA